jgi:hypothetical protein
MNPSTDENVAIELHDSDLVRLEGRDGKLVVVLAAYVHRSSGEPGRDPGTGWSETAHVHVGQGIVLEHSGTLPMRLDDGSVETAFENLQNAIPVDRCYPGPVRLTLYGFQGRKIVIAGDSLEARLKGDSVYVEPFPGV